MYTLIPVNVHVDVYIVLLNVYIDWSMYTLIRVNVYVITIEKEKGKEKGKGKENK